MVRIRTSKVPGADVNCWPDSLADDYIHRPIRIHQSRGKNKHWWRVAGEKIFAGTSPRTRENYGGCLVIGELRVEHHRCMIVEPFKTGHKTAGPIHKTQQDQYWIGDWSNSQSQDFSSWTFTATWKQREIVQRATLWRG
jgi:hypothetical protein